MKRKIKFTKLNRNEKTCDDKSRPVPFIPRDGTGRDGTGRVFSKDHGIVPSLTLPPPVMIYRNGMVGIQGLHLDGVEVGEVGGVDEALGDVRRMRHRRHFQTGRQLPHD